LKKHNSLIINIQQKEFAKEQCNELEDYLTI
jgi:hypothetical protein